MKLASRAGEYTFEDFREMVKDRQKADLISGVIFIASPDNTDANDLFMWLGSLMHDYVEVRDLGKIFGSRVAFRIDGYKGPEPDLGFVRKDRLHLVQRGFVDGPPDLAMEIVSPESVERDYERKRAQYEQAGISEYWIVDEDLKKVLLLRLDGKGAYREVRPRKGVLHSQVLEGFWLRIEWLWKETRPRKMDALAKILA